MNQARTFAVCEIDNGKKCILTTYHNPIRLTKNGIFSGCLKRINLYNRPKDDFYAENIKDIIEVNSTIRLDQYRYYLGNEDCFKILKNLTTKELLLIRDKNKKYVQVSKVFEANKVIHIELCNSNHLSINIKCASEKTAESPDIVALVYLKQSKSVVYATLELKGTNQTKDSEQALNLLKSLQREKALLICGFKKSTVNGFYEIPTVDFNHTVLNKLIDLGFKVFYFDKKEVSRSHTIKATFNEKQDWFDFRFSVTNEDGSETDITEEIIRNPNKHFIRIKDKIVELPHSLKRTRWKPNYSANQASIRINNKSLFYLDDIFTELNIGSSPLKRLHPFNGITLRPTGDITSILRPYQQLGIKWLKFLFINRLGGILADDMGLGKTLQCISLCADEVTSTFSAPLLIVTTKSLKINWHREFEKFAPHLKNSIIDFSNYVEKKTQKSNTIYIATYGELASHVSTLQTLSFQIAFFDEIQVAKNAETHIFRTLKMIKASCKIGLSGTPLENNLAELWSVFSIVFPELLGDRKDFLHRYANNIDLLKSQISPFLLRRTKSEVLTELPIYTEKIIYCRFSKEQRDLYDSLLRGFKRDLKRKMRKGEVYDTSRWLKYLLYLRETCCNTSLLPLEFNPNELEISAKNDYLLEAIQAHIEKHEKCVIFGQFIENLQFIKDKLLRRQIKVFYVDGTTTNRQAIIDDFNNYLDSVLLISLKTGGLGLNLTSAWYAYILDPWWNPAVEKQAADRLYRMGQTKDVTVIKLIAADTVEEKILNLQNEKKNLFEDIIEGNQTHSINFFDELKDYILNSPPH